MKLLATSWITVAERQGWTWKPQVTAALDDFQVDAAAVGVFDGLGFVAVVGPVGPGLGDGDVACGLGWSRGAEVVMLTLPIGQAPGSLLRPSAWRSLPHRSLVSWSKMPSASQRAKLL
ncbi:hypothetical protein [Streptomyces sp. cg40]|uniref:hypothetical protein n=1 Tax=Streptomyces sp. cg40 TaxID=3419764 RepID=UPI003CFE4C29